jgi:hypothetical protein
MNERFYRVLGWQGRAESGGSTGSSGRPCPRLDLGGRRVALPCDGEAHAGFMVVSWTLARLPHEDAASPAGSGVVVWVSLGL